MKAEIGREYEKTKNLIRQMIRSGKINAYPLEFNEGFACYFCGGKITSNGLILNINDELFYADEICYIGAKI